MGQIQSFGLTNLVVVVVRYFGGTLLGVGGLTSAYKQAAKDALSQADIFEKTIDSVIEIRFPYEATKDVERILKEEKASITNQNYGMVVTIEAAIRRSRYEQLTARLGRLHSIELLDTKKQHKL